MKAQENTQNALKSATDRLLEKHIQQETTAKNCGYSGWCEMHVKTCFAKNYDYASMAYNAATYFSNYSYLYNRCTADDLLKCF